MKKIPKQEYTAEFRELAVKRVKTGQTVGVVAKELGLIEQTLRNWVKAFEAGKLNGPGTKPVTPEQMELSRVRAENVRLKRENEIPKKSGGVLCERCAMKYAWIDAHRKEFELTGMCEALAVSASGYRAWKRGGTAERKRLTDTQMLALIRAIHAELKGAYGSPRITRELRERGFPESKERVERLMRENGIRARHKRRFKATTDSRHSLPVAPNQVWTADLTYIWTDEGWPYLAMVLDLFNREVVGWSIKPRMTTDIVIDALTMAWFRKKPTPGLIHHSDRGSQYASGAFQARLKEYGMICSMSRKGNCWDNAPTESFFNSLKNERVHGTRYGTRDATAADLFDHIEPFYNRRRKHSPLGYASPMKFLEGWISAQHEQKLAA
ncbi:IS3 family transposase [Caldichromatium japonicum]|uniref:IS3 family transposase n=1 Tax=Caldichromatium japonicum TaxID=2699430 RepID=UPI003CCCDD06